MFPECPSWPVSPDDEEFYYHDTILHFENEDAFYGKEGNIFTAISGFHTPYVEGPSGSPDDDIRSFECKILNSTSKSFAIRMQTGRDKYVAGQSARCLWLRPGTNLTSIALASNSTVEPVNTNCTQGSASECMSDTLKRLQLLQNTTKNTYNTYGQDYQ